MTNPKEGNVRYPLVLSEALKKAMEELAAKHHRSLNGEIAAAIEWWVKEKGEPVETSSIDSRLARIEKAIGQDLIDISNRRPPRVHPDGYHRYPEPPNELDSKGQEAAE